MTDRNQKIIETAIRYADWLERYGEKSQDHQDFYASKLGRTAKNI
jgi:hypothetical protein